ncbi:MAG: ankyrin repeat domain-containing protein [Proteobacteria bacterium]|nr:ankyrin repeat domain-containing protein [Pseudomonadota bacterium]
MGNPSRKADTKHLRPSFNGIIYPQPDKVTDTATGRTMLIDAILNGDSGKVEQLLTSGAHPGKTDYEGKSPLHYAAKAGNVEIVRLLLKHKAALNPPDKKLATPLFEALNSSSPLEIVECLLKAGADANITNRRGEVPLHAAARTANAKVIHCLAQATDNSGRPDNTNMTPLHYACKENTLEAVRSLISEGVPLFTANNDGDTPLHLATARTDSEVAKYLLTTEAAQLINAVNMNGKTPLHLAVSAYNYDLVQKMLLVGADPNMADSKGFTPLRLAAQQWNADPNMTLLLIQNGADVNGKLPITEGTPLLQALETNNTGIVRILLEHDADPNAMDCFGISPLIMAITRSGSAENVNLLLQAGADPNFITPQKQTALQVACSYGISDGVSLLLAKKADPNIADASGRTPLHMVLGRGYATLELARTLLEAGADPLQKDAKGVSAYDMACDFNDHQLQDLFKKKLGEKGVPYTPERRPPSPPR